MINNYYQGQFGKVLGVWQWHPQNENPFTADDIAILIKKIEDGFGPDASVD